MGLNSTEVAYAYGQFGSAITDSASASLYPPKGLVIVAITSLDEHTTFDASSGLVADDVDIRTSTINDATRTFPNTEYAAHSIGEFGLGSCHNDGGVDGATTTISAASVGIKIGQIIESAVMFPRSLTAPFKVKAYTSGATNFTASRAGANLASGAAETVYFFDNLSQGFGGLQMDTDDIIPTGTTIYGRWTAINLAAGRVIAYFGV